MLGLVSSQFLTGLFAYLLCGTFYIKLKQYEQFVDVTVAIFIIVVIVYNVELDDAAPCFI